MSRYSNDKESLQYFLEIYTKSKIFNHGVGNYGLDQVYLKIKKKINKNMKNIIVIFVPENHFEKPIILETFFRIW